MSCDPQVECEQDPVWLPPCELSVLTEEDIVIDEWMSIREVREREREREEIKNVFLTEKVNY